VVGLKSVAQVCFRMVKCKSSVIRSSIRSIFIYHSISSKGCCTFCFDFSCQEDIYGVYSKIKKTYEVIG
jgi:hypothetical protein